MEKETRTVHIKINEQIVDGLDYLSFSQKQKILEQIEKFKKENKTAE